MVISEETKSIDNGRIQVKQWTKELPVSCYRDDLEQIEVPWHWQDSFELCMITSGEVLVCVEAERFSLKTGDGFFINSGALNACSQLPDTSGPCTIQSIVFDPGIVDGTQDSIFYDNYIAPIITNNALKGLALTQDIAWHKEILRLGSNCWSSCLDSEEAIESGVRDIISQIAFLLSAHTASEIRPISSKEARDSDRIRVMLSYIDDHYRDDLNVATLSESAEISESEAMRCFHNMLGTTPIQYVKNYRIRKAAELLRVSDEKIVDIAIDCGFQDMSYFAKTFRESKGITPTDFRDKYKKSDSKDDK